MLTPPTTTTTSPSRRADAASAPSASPDGTKPSRPQLVLQLRLCQVGTTTLLGRPQHRITAATWCASLRRTGRRFAQAHAVQLSLAEGITPDWARLGTELFARFVARHLVGVRHLLLEGPKDLCWPDFWRQPAVCKLSRHLTSLTARIHHSGAALIAAALPITFPALTTLRLDVRTHCSPHEREAGSCDGLTVEAPAGLRTLRVLAYEDVPRCLFDRKYHDPPETPTFRLTVAGSPSHLETLEYLTEYRRVCDETHLPRPLLLLGHLPALRRLDVCFSVFDAQQALWQALPQVCPALAHLAVSQVVPPWPNEPRAGDWIVALVPLRGSLKRFEMVLRYASDEAAGVARLRCLVEESLPTTEVLIMPALRAPF